MRSRWATARPAATVGLRQGLFTLAYDSTPPFQEHGADVRVAGGDAELVIRAEISEEVPQGAIWLPILHERGAVQRLLTSGGGAKVSVFPFVT